jgi:hypothetical protein
MWRGIRLGCWAVSFWSSVWGVEGHTLRCFRKSLERVDGIAVAQRFTIAIWVRRMEGEESKGVTESHGGRPDDLKGEMAGVSDGEAQSHGEW